MGMVNEYLKKSLEQLSSESLQERRAAAVILGKIGNNDAVAPLLKCLNDSNPSVQKAIIRALKEIADSRAIEPLISLFKMTSLTKVKAQIAWALGYFIYDDFDLEFLLDSLKEDSLYLQEKIVFAFGNKRYKKSIPELIQIIESADTISLRQMAMWALARMPDSQVLEPLINALNDPNEKIRRRATKSLYCSPYTKTQLASIFNRIHDKSFYGTSNVIHLIGQLRYYPAIPHLISIVRSESNLRLRETTVRALSRMGDAQVYRLFVKLLDDPSMKIRVTVINYIKYDHNLEVEIIAKVIDKLDDETTEVRLAIARFIHAITGTLSIPIELYNRMPKLLAISENDRDRQVRNQLQYALLPIIKGHVSKELNENFKFSFGCKKNIKRRKPKDPLDELTFPKKPARITNLSSEIIRDVGKLLSIIEQDTCWLQRWKATVALAKHYNNPRIIEPLIIASKDQHTKVRLAAVYCLQKTKNPKALEPLLDALNDIDRRVRRTASYSLDAIFDIKEKVPSLLANLKDKTFLGRVEIIRFLKEMEPELYLDTYLELLVTEEDRDLIKAILYVFYNHRNDKILNALIEIMNNSIDEFRGNCLSILLYGPHLVKTKKEELLKLYNDSESYGRYEIFYLLGGENIKRAICSDKFIIEGLFSELFFLKSAARELLLFHQKGSLLPKDYNEVIRLH